MRNCVVLGSGRSGTSLTAGLLVGAGYHAGDDLLEPSESNPRGFFESRLVNALNEDLLAQVVPKRPRARLLRPLFRHRPRRFQRWLAVAPAGAGFDVDDGLRARLAAALPAAPWCVKDPRFTYTLRAWRPVLGDAAYVCVFRHPGETAASILAEQRRTPALQDLRLSTRRLLTMWERMYGEVLREAGEGDWLFVDHAQLVAGDGVERLGRHVGVDLDPGFVEPALHRSRPAPVPGATLALYDRLRRLAA